MIIYFKRVKEINLKEQENDIFTINGTLTNYFREQWNLFTGNKGEKVKFLTYQINMLLRFPLAPEGPGLNDMHERS